MKPKEPQVPAYQLALAIQRIVDRETRELNQMPTLGLERRFGIGRNVCDRAQITQRQFFRWAKREKTSISLDLADTVLTYLDLLWFDVWNTETTDPVTLERVRRLMEPDVEDLPLTLEDERWAA